MKNEKKRVEDFPHQITFQLNKSDYIEYSRVQSKPQWELTKRKARFYLVIFSIISAALLARGYFEEGRMAQLYIVAAILIFAYQIFNLYYSYKVFPKALTRSIEKELEKDPRLMKSITICFEPDKIISFSEGVHQASFFIEDIRKKEQTENNIILGLRNGKNLVIPKRETEKADNEIKNAIESLPVTKTKKEKTTA